MSFFIPKGFLFSVTEAAIKKPGKKDLALIYSETDSIISGMFTTNKVKAAPVRLDMTRIKSGRGRAIVVNSGNANACTGKKGLKDAFEITEIVSRFLKIDKNLVYICSTGVIGTPLPMDRILSKIPYLVEGLGQFSIDDVARAIMTTDTFPKIETINFKIGDCDVNIAGICKGAGMIAPNMATMLCFLLTDANIEKKALEYSLKIAVNNSFNRITIDGDMSTNDTVLIMANGMSGGKQITSGSPEQEVFLSALKTISKKLSELIVMDAEGATKVIGIEIINAKNEREAKRAAFAIANSLLVKTAIYGNDANWGRLMAALGYSGVYLREDKVDIYFNNLKIVENGTGMGNDTEANKELDNKKINIKIDLKVGNSNAKVLTSDLTEDYVKINAEYRT